jgi:hypothetical protein
VAVRALPGFRPGESLLLVKIVIRFHTKGAPAGSRPEFSEGEPG